MSISILYHAFGIKDYDLIKTEFKGGKVVFHLEKKRMKQSCPHCGNVYDIIYKGQVHREIKTIPIGFKEVVLSLHLHRIHCKKCGKTQLEKLLVSPPYKQYSYALANFVVASYGFVLSRMLQTAWTCPGIQWKISISKVSTADSKRDESSIFGILGLMKLPLKKVMNIWQSLLILIVDNCLYSLIFFN